ncbi:MAG: metalloprotease PmbA [Gammaproteobacteria bacterium]|jgi:PmbA protein
MTEHNDISLGVADLESLVADVLKEARAQGATQAEAAASLDAGLDVTVRMGEVETLEYQRDRGLGVTVYFGKRKGSASTADLGRQAIAETVRAAASIARHTGEDPFAGLADADLMAGEVPDLDIHHPWDLSAEEAIELGLECENAARARDPRIVNSEGATVHTHSGIRVYGNSHGFIGGYRGTTHSISCAVLGREGESMQRDHWYTVARHPQDLESAAAVGERAADNTVRRLGSRRLSTRKAPVLYVPQVARGLIGHFLGAIRGASQYRESSFLLHAAGERIFPEFMQINERPRIPRALGSAPFDGEGVATRERALVSDGVVTGYILDSYSARKLGLATTGNAGGVHNVEVMPGALDLDGLLAEMGTGLVVTELMGQGVNGVTGDYSRGAAGFWVENGRISHPVEEVTVAGNLRDMYRRIVAVGNDLDLRGNIRTGSILIEEMTIAGE